MISTQEHGKLLLIHGPEFFAVSKLTMTVAMVSALGLGFVLPPPENLTADIVAIFTGIAIGGTFAIERITKAVLAYMRKKSQVKIEIQKAEEVAYRESYQCQIDEALERLRESAAEKQALRTQVDQNTLMIRQYQNENRELEDKVVEIALGVLTNKMYLKPVIIDPALDEKT